MRYHFRWAIIIGGLLVASTLQAGQLNKFRKVDMKRDGNNRTVIIHTDKEPTFTVFRLYDPMRVVIDVSGGDVSTLKGPQEVQDGIIGDIAFHQFRNGERSIGRVIVGFMTDMRYEVQSFEQSIVLTAFQGDQPPDTKILRAPPPPAPPIDFDAVQRAENARQVAEQAAQKARKEREAAIAMQKQFATKQETIAQREAQIQAEEQEVENTKTELVHLKKKMQTAIAAEKDKIAQKAAELEARQEEAQRIRSALKQEQLQAQQALHDLQDKQEKAQAAALMAEQQAHKKITEAEQALNKAQKERELATQKLAQVKQEQSKVKAEKDRIKKTREVLEREQHRHQKLAATLKEQREKIEADSKRYDQLHSKLEQERKQVDQERKKLAQERATLQQQQKQLLKQQERQAKQVKQEQQTKQKRVSKQTFHSKPGIVSNIVVAKQDNQKTEVLVKLRSGETESSTLVLDKPARLVLDLHGAKKEHQLRRNISLPIADISNIRLGQHSNKLRVVFDFKQSQVPQYKIEKRSNGVAVIFDKQAIVSKPSVQPRVASISKVSFDKQSGHSIITIAASTRPEFRVDDSKPDALILEMKQARISSDQERALDTSAFKGAVSMVSSYQDKFDPPVVKVLVNLKQKTAQTIRWVDDELKWEIADGVTSSPAMVAKKESLPSTHGITSSIQTPTATGAYRAQSAIMTQSSQMNFAAPKKQSKRITINLKDADVVNVIRLIAEVSGENIITSDDVKGKITLRLRNVPWEQALEIILATKGYGKVRKNNIIRIAPLEELQREKEIELQKKKAEQLVAEPVKRVLYINYAQATELKEQLVPIMSGRGSIQEVERTNALIINELPDKINDVIRLAKHLDTQTPQVLIEARIVEASSNYLQQLGIQWGGSSVRSSAYGNSTGLPFPNFMSINGAADDSQANQDTGVLTPSNYAVNLPAPIASGSGGGIGFSFGNAANTTLLNVRLTALEETGAARIISAPRVATIDNKKAKIEQGIDIPISVVSAAGVNTKFISASLELEVQPHVTNDGSVLMQIKVSKNEPDFSRTGASGDPTIQKKMAETEVLVRDGDTTVIGGIYTRTTTQVSSKVPFLSKIPILGWLFRSNRNEDSRAELLVFITPRILNRQATALSSGDLALDDIGKSGD